MKQFKDLDIIGPEEELRALINTASASLPANWRRDPEAEARLAKFVREGKDAGFTFCRDAKDGDVKVGLFLAREGRRLYVPNIIPLEDRELSMDQYNGVLDEFADMLHTHLPPDSQLTIRVTSDDATITDWISVEAAKLLQRFSDLANRSTGSAHPLDFERWALFLIQVHREGPGLDSDILSRWLVEELKWPPDRVDKLVEEYEFARDLLRIYDRS